MALDCAVAAIAAGATKVAVYYRRSYNQMPAWKRELDMAVRLGVEFEMLSIPVSFVGKKGKLVGARFLKAELGKPGKDGRRVPVAIPGSGFQAACDIAVIAAGQKAEAAVLGQLAEDKGCAGLGFKVDPKTLRVRDNLFVGGDLAGRGTIVEAAGDGKVAAAAIISFLNRG